MTTIYPTTNLAEIFPITAMNELKNAQAESFTNNIITTGSINKALASAPQQIHSASLGAALPEIPTPISPFRHLGNYLSKNWPIIVFAFVAGGITGYLIVKNIEEKKQHPKKN